jgi:hypothetical protein
LSGLWQQIRAVLELVLGLQTAVFYAGSWMFSGFKTGTLSGLFTMVTA